MRETWLQPNRRAIWLGCAPPIALVGVGAGLMSQADSDSRRWLTWVGAALISIGATLTVLLLRHLGRPRIAYHDGCVLFYLKSGPPLAVPVQLVEAFFVGQGPATLPGGIDAGQRTANLVARLSQNESDWRQRDVKAALGKWCDGYVTISGTWCEPLNQELLRTLNRRLADAKRKDTSPS
jgi:hypothetical protein